VWRELQADAEGHCGIFRSVREEAMMKPIKIGKLMPKKG
jgi:hypothetical protein